MVRRRASRSTGSSRPKTPHRVEPSAARHALVGDHQVGRPRDHGIGQRRAIHIGAGDKAEVCQDLDEHAAGRSIVVGDQGQGPCVLVHRHLRGSFRVRGECQRLPHIGLHS